MPGVCAVRRRVVNAVGWLDRKAKKTAQRAAFNKLPPPSGNVLVTGPAGLFFAHSVSLGKLESGLRFQVVGKRMRSPTTITALLAHADLLANQ